MIRQDTKRQSWGVGDLGKPPGRTKESTKARQFEDEVAYYYDFHPTEEDLMGETSVHRDLVSYLALVLKWQFRGQRCAIYDNLNFYQTANAMEYPLAPDIAVIKGIEHRSVRSWRVGKTGPAPQVVEALQCFWVQQKRCVSPPVLPYRQLIAPSMSTS